MPTTWLVCATTFCLWEQFLELVDWWCRHWLFTQGIPLWNSSCEKWVLHSITCICKDIKFLAVTSGLTSGFMKASGWDCDQAPADLVHHTESLLLSAFFERLPSKILEESCRADILLSERLVVNNARCSSVNTFEGVDVFTLVWVPCTGAVLKFWAN